MYANNKRVGRGRYPTPEYKAWKEQAGLMLRRQKPYAIVGPADVIIDISNKGRGDVDNRSKGVLDLLVQHGVLKDDSKAHVRSVWARWADIEGCRVTIVPVECDERLEIARAAASLGAE